MLRAGYMDGKRKLCKAFLPIEQLALGGILSDI